MSLRDSRPSLERSVWNNKLKFNGFFFAVNLELIAPAAFDDENLFDPGNIMVSQEDTLMHSMESLRLIPKICRYAFVYHFKSVTVKAANYVLGSRNETRNNLEMYHPELTSGVQNTSLHYPELFKYYSSSFQLPKMEMYPKMKGEEIVIGLIVPKISRVIYDYDIDTALVCSLLPVFLLLSLLTFCLIVSLSITAIRLWNTV